MLRTAQIRPLIYAVALAWLLALYAYAASTIASPAAAMLSLVRTTGLSALTLLVITLIPGLLRVFLPGFRWNPLLIHGRRAMGLSTFGFALVHSVLAFVYTLGGSLQTILFLEPRHRVAIALSLTALLILAAMAITSSDHAVRKMGYKRWKRLHRLVYIAVALAFAHAFLIGTHFAVRTSAATLALLGVAAVLLLLEVWATVRMLRRQP